MDFNHRGLTERQLGYKVDQLCAIANDEANLRVLLTENGFDGNAAYIEWRKLDEDGNRSTQVMVYSLSRADLDWVYGGHVVWA